ncbi:hypothetical protein AAG906_039210 [Vitis piasezkii]
MVDERNPTSSGISKPDSSKTEKQVNSSVLPSDASKSDLSNPYFTHHSDHPGLVLISKPLNGDNYSAWRMITTQKAMTLALNAKNKLGFVNGTIKAPSEETHPDDYATWSRCNDMVHSWIVNTLNPEISDSVIYYATAHEVWEDLCERFSQSNAPRIFEIQREIAYHRQEQLSISVYYTKLKSLWDELASYNDASSGAQQDQQRLMQFLMGLNESYSAIRGQILLMNPLPSVRQAYSSVCQEEKQRLLSATHTAAESNSSAAMAVRSNQMKNNSAGNARSDRSDRFYSGSQDSRRFDQDKRRSGSSRGRPQCTYCGEMGHFVEKCYQLHGYPPGHPKARTGSNFNRHKNTSVANQVSDGANKDGGKSVLTGITEAQLQQLLSLLNDKDGGTSSQANAAVAKPGLFKISSHRWIIDSGATDHISSSPKLFLHKDKNISLPPVLLPSGEKANIVAKGSLPLNFVYYLRDDLATRRMIGLGKQRDGLYYLAALTTNKTETNSYSSPNRQPTCNLTTSSTDLWHSRLGHQHRLPFGTSEISSEKPFDLIHCDIWGRYKHSSLSGAHYFLTIVDDYTRFTWIFLMKHKDEAQPLIKHFFSYVSTQFASHIKIFRSDNGGEFLSLQSFFKDNGVLFQHSCVYTPQQNGVVERKHQCALTVHIINRLPSPILSFKTPFERLYLKPPTYSHLRVFGCLAYATNVHVSHKFDHRAIACIFIGYPVGQKAYKLFNLSTRKIFTRDVRFHENRFPYASFESVLPTSNLGYSSGPIPAPIHDPTPSHVTNPSRLILPPTTDSAPSSSFAPNSDTLNSVTPISSSTISDLPSLPAEQPTANPTPALLKTYTRRPKHAPSPLLEIPTPPSPSVETLLPTTSSLPSSPSLLLSSPNPSNPSPSLLGPPQPAPTETLRRSNRSHNPPAKLQDYVCSHITHACSDQSPSLFPGLTKEAMRSELQALQANGTWTLTSLPTGKTPIGCRWVYKIKHRFTQLEGVDYQDTFSPTAKIITVRCLLALAAARRWSLHQLDVNNAFLHGDLHEEIYMSPPPGLRRQGEENLVCRLHKSLYGLKQASRQWFSKFSKAIQAAGYVQSRADYSLFTRIQGKSFTALLIYVDDILITGNDSVSIAAIKKFLHSQFRLKDLGDLKYFLGIEVSSSKNGIFISQRKYALEIIKDAGLLGAAPIDTPMERGLKLSDKSDLLKDPGHYRRLVGRLIYLTVSRPDITYSVHVLSRFMHQPRKLHMEAALRVVRYLKNAPGQGLFFSSNSDFRLRAYCDSDWAGCPITRRSTTGYCVFLGPSLVSWRSKRQKTVSLSSAEAEYRAMTGACCELTWLRYLLRDLGVLHREPSLLYCDNKAALHIAANPVFHERTRHIEMDCHYIRDKIQDGSVATRFVNSAHQLADVLTKALGKEVFTPMIRKLGVQDIHSPT